MPDYRRANTPGGTYCFTVNTYRRQTFLPAPTCAKLEAARQQEVLKRAAVSQQKAQESMRESNEKLQQMVK